MGSILSSSSTSPEFSGSSISNFKDNSNQLCQLSNKLKLGQTLAIFGEEVLDDDEHDDKLSSPDRFNFWLCRVEEKMSVHSQQDDCHISCYGTNSRSGIFYFWLLRDFHQQQNEQDEPKSSTLSSTSKYNFRRPTEEEVHKFSDNAIQYLQNHKEIIRRGSWRTVVPSQMWRDSNNDNNSSSTGLLPPGFHVFENEVEQDKYQLYGRKIMADFMAK